MTTNEQQWLAERFEQQRPHLRAVAYRLLGSRPDAEEAVQDVWLRMTGAGVDGVENLGGWMTSIVARVCLSRLQARKVRPEAAAGLELPDPVVLAEESPDPEREALLADSVSVALLVLLERLAPAERLAFVLHDLFDLPFEEIAPLVGRTPTAARQLASRARRRVKGASVTGAPDLAEQRRVVEAFFIAGRTGDLAALLQVLDPEVVRRSDTPAFPEVRGAERVAKSALGGARAAVGSSWVPVRVNGGVGVVVVTNQRPTAVLGFTVAAGRIRAIDVFTDPARLGRLGLEPMVRAAALGRG